MGHDGRWLGVKTAPSDDVGLTAEEKRGGFYLTSEYRTAQEVRDMIEGYLSDV